MDDTFKGEISRRGQDCAAQCHRTMFREFAEGTISGLTLDRSRYALWDQQPPRNHVAIPGVDYHFDLLIEEISLDDFRLHQTRDTDQVKDP